MLAIQDIANNNQTDTITTAPLVVSVELVDDSTIRVWFNRAIENGTTTSNYIFSGPVTVPIKFAQYEVETINGNPVNSKRGVRLYLTGPLIPGQWNISFVSSVSSSGSLIAINDVNTLALPDNSEIIFDVVDKTSQDTLATGEQEDVVSKFIPKAFRNKRVYSAILEGIETGDAIVREMQERAFDQYFLSTASDKYLSIRARDSGIEKPWKLGISDVDFRRLSIDTINDKLTNNALYNILDIMYGPDAVRGYVETQYSEPFDIINNSTLDFLFDGVVRFSFTAKANDFLVPIRASAIELSSALNFSFQKHGINAYSFVEPSKKVRVYSNTKGPRSSVAVTGGTLQPSCQFDSAVFGAIPFQGTCDLSWVLSNPRVGYVRFQEISENISFVDPVLKIGDYVTIIGAFFPEELRGSFLITDVSYTVSGSTITQWFEIKSDYIVDDTTTNTSPINLPLIAAVGGGVNLTIIDSGYNASVNNIIVHRNGTDEINNVSGDYIINTDGASITLIANDVTSNWEIV